MDHAQAKRIIEALLFVFGQPVTLKRITEVVPDLDAPQVRSLIHTLNAEYTTAAHAFAIQEVAGGYQLVTDHALAPWIQRAQPGQRLDALSKAALETLAIIAYRQPITKMEIEAIRGVDVTASLDSLTERRMARVIGRRDSPGRPFLYGTTTEFLRHFGLSSLDALPPMAQPILKEPEAESPPAATTLADHSASAEANPPLTRAPAEPPLAHGS